MTFRDRLEHRSPHIEMSDDTDSTATISVKKYGAGYALVRITGPAAYAAAAEQAIKGALTCLSVILPDHFRESMRAAGVPDAAIEEYLHSAWIDDEACLALEPR